MKKKTLSLILALFMVVNVLSTLVSASPVTLDVQTTNATNNGQYEIYPLPQAQSYYNSNVTITNEVNLVVESGIDVSTQNFLDQILASKSITATKSSSVVAGKTNVLVGVKNSTGYVDTYFNDHINYDATIFTKQDAHVLDIHTKTEQSGNIAILGATTDAAYYALATLKMIFDQIPGKEIQTVKYEDYADTNFRGFIEGFYGFPWSHEDRISLMRFGGQFKMNTYIFAPKDDVYHNSSWRTLYPAAELAKIKELVDAGHESKTQFVWAIHPGFNMINWNNYDAELATLLAKLEQLHSVGVRQFGLFMDDISTAQSLTDKEKHVKLITDVANWVTSKGDVKSLIYCPPFYNQSWTGEGGKPYLQALSNVPANVEIMWTGNSVVGTVNTADMQWVKDATGRNPYMWLNWPVNDYRDSRLMLGKGEVLKPGTHNISGVVSNPMGHAELSKIALFAVADYTWNVDDFNTDQSWLDSFDYVAPEVAQDLHTIAYHLSDPSPSTHGLVVGESENLKADLELFLTQYNNGEPAGVVGTRLIAALDNILQAIQSFRANSLNTNMVNEINPWLNSLQQVVQADKSSIASALAVQNNDIDLAWGELAKASSALAKSRTFTIKKLKYPDVTVEAGSKRLVPFAQQLINKLDAKIYTSIDPDYVIPTAMMSYGSPTDLNKMIDGDVSTYTYVQKQQVNGDWYGLDLGKTTSVYDIKITQGRTNTDNDIFQRGVLEYSTDGQTWTSIGAERSGYSIVVTELDLQARYVRYRLTHAGIPGGKPDLWTAVREFTINATAGKTQVYTNVDTLKGSTVIATEVSAELSNISATTLKPSEYVGIKLPSIEQISEITVESINKGAVLETSENGVVWQVVSVTGGSYPNAAYVRLINKSSADIPFDLNKLTVKLNKFGAPVVTHNYESVYQGNLQNVYNGNLGDKVWFGGMQTAGKYVSIDLGGVVNVENVAVVIGDGEGDYFRKGDLQLSLDGQTWTTIHSFNNPGDKSLNFPTHEVPYRFKRVQVDQVDARYVRLISTQTNNVWMALNEIIVNEGIERPGTVKPGIQASPSGGLGNEVVNAIDHRLATFYKPAGASKPGTLNYKLSNETRIEKIIILQNPSGISNAEVSVRDESGWHTAGTLSQSYNSVNTSNYQHVLEVKLQWNGQVIPEIYEIIPVKRVGDVTPPVDDGEPTTNLSGVASVLSGQEFALSFGLKSVTDNVYAMDITMEYDSQVLSFVNATSLKEGIKLLETKETTPGRIRMVIISEGATHAITGDMQFLELNYRAKQVTQNTNSVIAITQAIMGDALGVEKEAIASTHSIQVTVDVPVPGIPGDVNNDGKVSIGDLALVAANYGKNTTSPDWESVKHLDVTKDGTIDISDLALVARKILQ